ncbi:MAG: lipocalin-like domain-containing protein [Acidobacteriota bacterium]
MKRHVALALALAVATMAAGCRKPADSSDESSVTAILGGTAAEGFARAVEPRSFRFPADHGPHPDFRNEWWYFTGHLKDSSANHYGYQLTFFRNRLLAPGEAPARSSPWATEQAFLAHFAVSDATGRNFRSFERWNRGALGLAGARSEPSLRVWLADWELRDDGAGGFEITARAGDRALQLQLTPRRSPILQGDGGLSRKGREPGNASYYYSMPRLASRGSLEIGGRELTVEGQSWLDREWSTSVLETGQVGWDWFSISLSNGTDLMFFRLRRNDGRIDTNSSGSLAPADGPVRPLKVDDVTLRERRYWTSDRTGARYPVAWTLELPDLALWLEVEPLLDGQELAHSFRYWEGAVRVTGEQAGEPVSGEGYVELTGYDR